MNNTIRLQAAYDALRASGRIHTQGDLAALLNVNRSSISRALAGDPKYLTDSFVRKIEAAVQEEGAAQASAARHTIPLIPIGARAGTLADFADAIRESDCERIVSPIRGVDYAIQVSGDSMAPSFPSGSQILIKRIDEEAFVAWGETYLLDTVNGPVLKIVRNTEAEGVVECVSLNPAYPPFRVKCSDIRGWYRVLMVMTLK